MHTKMPSIGFESFLFRSISACVIILLWGVVDARCQNTDTICFYHKSIGNELQKVEDISDADFIRVLYPADKSKKNSIPVKQFYKNGKIDFIGTVDRSIYSRSAVCEFVGDFVSFYPNGKRRTTVYYTKGEKDGMEYIFYENGKISSSKKYTTFMSTFGLQSKAIYLDFFDVTGRQICQKGNGEWITYDESLRPIERGPVKDGLFDGEWHGKTLNSDSISYAYTYKKGVFISGIGYRLGRSYPFKDINERSSVVSHVFEFNEELRRNFWIPKELKIRKDDLDTASISFIVETNGHLTNPEIAGTKDPALILVLQNALDKCQNEQPCRYFGVPLRTKVSISFAPVIEYGGYNQTVKKLRFSEDILGFD